MCPLERQPFDTVTAVDTDRTGEETHVDGTLGILSGRPLNPLPEHPDISRGDLVLRQLPFAPVIKVKIGASNLHGCFGQLTKLLQLLGRERCLDRTTPPHQNDSTNGRIAEGVEDVPWHIGLREFIFGLTQDPHDVHGDIPDTDDGNG